LTECRLRRAPRVIAKRDHLARDAHFLLGLQRSCIAFTATDMPNANRLTVGIMAMVAEEERRAISERTKAGSWRRESAGCEARRPAGEPQEHGNGGQRAREVRRAKAAARAEDVAPVIEAARAEGITSAAGSRRR
jgi:DNA invertase Pin-like site-specific DNA recombinase